jgi:hypothetical protein
MNSRAFPKASSAEETTAMPTSREACAGTEAGVMADLTREQSLAAQTDGPVLVLAGAGTGKTRTLTAAVVRRILISGIKPARILAVTFTNKAAAEMSSRIRSALDGIAPPHWVGTFHGLGARQLRAEPEVAGLRPGFEILDSDDMRRFVRRTMKAMSFASDGEGPAGRDPVKVMCNRISKFKDSLIAPDEAATRVEGMIAAAGRSGLRIDAAGLREAAQLYGEYQRRLRDGNAADFGDLLLWPTRAMQGSDVDAEIARLERLRVAHTDNQLSIRHTVEGSRNTIADATRKLDGIRRDIERRVITRGERFAMVIQDRAYTDRKSAGGALLRLIAEAGWESRKNTAVGSIGGFDLAIGVSRDLRMRATEAVLILQCDTRQRIELPDEPTPLGVIARLEAALDRFETDQREQEERLCAARTRLADYESRIGAAFEFEAELTAKRAEHDHLEAELAAQSNGEVTEAKQDAVSAFEELFGVVIQFPGRGRFAETESAEVPEDEEAEAG